MKTEAPSPLVPSLLFIGVLLIAVLMAVNPVTLHTPAPPGPAGVVGGDEASLRLALARFLDLGNTKLPTPLRTELLVGRMPSTLDFVPPIPPGATLVGSLIGENPDQAQIIYDSSQPPDAMLAVFVESFKRQSFIQSPADETRLRSGPDDTARSASFCRATDGMFARVGIDRSPDGANTARLYIIHQPDTPCPLPTRADMPEPTSLLPELHHPSTAWAANTGWGGGSGPGEANWSEGIGVKMTPEALAGFYRPQLEAAGWTFVTLASSDYGAWSSWTLKDKDGSPWTGSLIIVASPNTDDKVVTLEARR